MICNEPHGARPPGRPELRPIQRVQGDEDLPLEPEDPAEQREPRRPRSRCSEVQNSQPLPWTPKFPTTARRRVACGGAPPGSRPWAGAGGFPCASSWIRSTHGRGRCLSRPEIPGYGLQNTSPGPYNDQLRPVNDARGGIDTDASRRPHPHSRVWWEAEVSVGSALAGRVLPFRCRVVAP